MRARAHKQTNTVNHTFIGLQSAQRRNVKQKTDMNNGKSSVLKCVTDEIRR